MHFVFYLCLISLISSLDNLTQSNYENITIDHIEGIFEPDFTTKILTGELNYTFKAKTSGDKILLDTNYINIEKIINQTNNAEITYQNGIKEEILGQQIIIPCSFSPNDIINLTIKYKTTPGNRACQFLDKNFTKDKTSDFFYTTSILIEGRGVLPSQDTPGVKFTYRLGIKVPKEMTGFIGGILDGQNDADNNKIIYYYNQVNPVPNYLVSLAAGVVYTHQINENISVYAENFYLEKANKTLDELPKIMTFLQEYIGEYQWNKFNILILPGSFPYSCIENPSLAFCSPCTLDEDKSLLDRFVHVLARSWAGNSVTPDNWEDYWLTGGLATFIQRKVFGHIRDGDYVKADASIGLTFIDFYLDDYGENDTLTTLSPNLTGKSPDDYNTDIPLEKGYNFLYYIETLISEEKMKLFLQNYFREYKFKFINMIEFKNFFIKFCKDNSITDDILNKIDWEAWIHHPGKCAVKNDFTNNKEKEVSDELKKFKAEDFSSFITKFKSWDSISKSLFFADLFYNEGKLNMSQHKVLTEDLKLYEENFFIKNYYFFEILKNTDEFLENEEKNLISFLKDIGAIDYMIGIYELFYRRDEILCEQTYNELVGYYHIYMNECAKREIEKAKNEFPIIELELKDKDQCLYFTTESKINIISDKYKESLGKLNFIGVDLKNINSGEKINLNCILDKEEKYCTPIQNITSSGEFKIDVEKRIQAENYAVKVHSSNFTIKISVFVGEIKIEKDNFEIDYNIQSLLQIKFINEPDNNIYIQHEGQNLNCSFQDSKTLNCPIKNILTYDEEKPTEYKEHKLKLLDYCGKEINTLTVKVKDTSSLNLERFTQSNYGNIIIVHIEGIFEPDFTNKVLNGELKYTFKAKTSGENIFLDTNYINIEKIVDQNNQVITYQNGSQNDILGQQIIIPCEFKQNDIFNLTIFYQTTQGNRACQFLDRKYSKEQISDFFYTTSTLIEGRGVLPSQDTPAVKFTYRLGIKVPSGIRGFIGGIFDEQKDEGDKKIFYYAQKNPVPNYLVGLAAGYFEEGNIGDITIYAEKFYLEKAKKTLEGLPNAMTKMQEYIGDYQWTKFNILILPGSFPYSCIENPSLAFCSPCTLDEDKSLFDRYVHMLARSWAGNSVTPDNWRDFWLTAGIATFIQRKVIGSIEGDDYVKTDASIALTFIDFYLEEFGENDTLTTLSPDLVDRSPDNYNTDIPFEKGYNFLYYIEKLITEEKMKSFLKQYFEKYKFSFINTTEFKNYFNQFCKDNSISDDILSKINWDAWIKSPGQCQSGNNFNNTLEKEVSEELDKFFNTADYSSFIEKFQNWPVISKALFLARILYKGKLNQVQHKVFTDDLKLNKESFYIKNFYFSLIMDSTDEFLGNEEDNLVSYIKECGAIDYMIGFYSSFYRRDEIECKKTYDELADFYHIFMKECANREIEREKMNFPILELELKDKGQCLYFTTQSKLNIISEQYKESLEKLNLKEVDLKNINSDEKINLNCILDKEEKYCTPIQNHTFSGEFKIDVEKRIQADNYAVKKYNGINIIKVFGRESKIQKDSYEVDYKNDGNVKIEFIEQPDKNIYVQHENQKLTCTLTESKTLDCAIEGILSYDVEKPTEYKEHKLTLFDYCGTQISTLTVKVKNSPPDNINTQTNNPTDESDGLSGGAVVGIIFGLIIVIGVVVVIVVCVKKKSKSTSDEIEKLDPINAEVLL